MNRYAVNMWDNAEDNAKGEIVEALNDLAAVQTLIVRLLDEPPPERVRFVTMRNTSGRIVLSVERPGTGWRMRA